MTTKTKPPGKKRGPKPKPPDELMVNTTVRLPPELKRDIEQWVAASKVAGAVPFNYSMAKFLVDAAIAYLRQQAPASKHSLLRHK